MRTKLAIYKIYPEHARYFIPNRRRGRRALSDVRRTKVRAIATIQIARKHVDLLARKGKATVVSKQMQVGNPALHLFLIHHIIY